MLITLENRESRRTRCAYCHEAVEAGGLKGCERCCTSLHELCWSEAGRCPTLGCVPPRERLRVALPSPEDPSPRGWTARRSGLASGLVGALFCWGGACGLPAFGVLFDGLSFLLPWSLPSLALLALRDRWVEPSEREAFNSLLTSLTVCGGVGLAFVLGLSFVPGPHQL